MTYTFTQEEMQQASATWGCNCGPSALAFALQVKLDVVRTAIPGFSEKGYTNPTMMAAALVNVGRAWNAKLPLSMFPSSAFDICPALVRVQWTGPWTASGANPRWAYRQTHWISTYLDRDERMVFDCNGGINTFDVWQDQIVPFIVKHIPSADGGWFPTHVWRLVAANDGRVT